MRIFLLPVSTRRSLIYCERLQQSTSPNNKLPISERIINRAAKTWADWEQADKGWRKQLVVRGNKLLSKIAFEEWGLKSLPPLTKARIEDMRNGNLKFECVYPSRFLPSSQSRKDKDSIAHEILARLAIERQTLHKRRLWTSILWMPLTIPFTVIPVIPNIPFFYLCFRAYSHFRALYGSKLLAHLTDNPGLLAIRASKELDEVYAKGLSGESEEASKAIATMSDEKLDTIAREALSEMGSGGEKVERMLLRPWSGSMFAEEAKLPELQIEIERAVTQVRTTIEKQAVQESQGKDGNEKDSK